MKPRLIPRLIEDWPTVLWHSATTRTTALVTYLLGAIGQYYFAGFLFIGFLPQAAQIIAAGLLTLLVFGGPIILSRLVQQPRLAAKIEDKRDGQ